jgi:hypothetical protein
MRLQPLVVEFDGEYGWSEVRISHSGVYPLRRRSFGPIIERRSPKAVRQATPAEPLNVISMSSMKTPPALGILT